MKGSKLQKTEIGLRITENLGFISIILVVAVMLICTLIAPDAIVNTPHFALSNFGILPETALLFNVTLIISGFIFLIYINKSHFTKINRIIFSIASIALVGIGLIPMNSDYRLHWYCAIVYFLGFNLGIFIYGIEKRDRFCILMAILQIFIAILLSSQTIIAISEIAHTAITLIFIFYVRFKVLGD